MARHDAGASKRVVIGPRFRGVYSEGAVNRGRVEEALDIARRARLHLKAGEVCGEEERRGNQKC